MNELYRTYVECPDCKDALDTMDQSDSCLHAQYGLGCETCGDNQQIEKMTPLSFREAMACDAVGYSRMHVTGATGEEGLMLSRADLVLTMPEMGAIKYALGQMAKAASRGVGDTARQYLEAYNLPNSVIEWVLE